MARVRNKIEILDGDGNLLWIVKDIESATLDKSINNPAVLSFLCPNSTQTALIRSSLTRRNSIQALKNNVPIFTGPVGLVKTKHYSSIDVQVDALDYMANLKGEFVELYDGLDSVPDHVAAILAQQVSSRPVLVGAIEPTVDRDITITKAYQYDGITKLRDTVGGYLQVDADRKLNWYWNLVESSGQQIRYRQNMIGITREEDSLNFGKSECFM